ncbi:carbohydrate-binding module family 18 protein [Piromyces sp. E2]|nr:carbohydrate-binding module family 18 protein [Piromyces sp. E2]|eukprot:OUM57139.1 carbohydrate-binding module family 18 protein [Piromyces sp. E2]
MRFNTLLKLSSFLSLANVAYSYSGRMTYYGNSYDRPSINAIPACGIDGVDLETDYFIALNENQYNDSLTNRYNPNSATVCNRCIKVTYKNRWVVGRIIDKCPSGSCKFGSLDLSPTIFETLENLDTGVIYADWEYTDCSYLGQSGRGDGPGLSSGSYRTTTRSVTRKTSTRTTRTLKSTPTESYESIPETDDLPISYGQCGEGIGRCAPGSCCSQYGWCGNTSQHCGVGCQPRFGICRN